MSSPSITFGALKAELRAELFPTGEPYNLRVAHDKMFVEAIYDLQQKVDCFQINNTQVVPFCATKFQCGMTVFTAPRGRIWRVSTVDRLVATTGEESDSAPIQWCSEIIYKQVDYCRLEKFLDKQLGCSCSLWSQVPPPYCTKTPSPRFTRFPVPDNSAYADFPELPLGFIYPTPTTDVSCGRSKTGVWAQHSGRIYLAPWIQSTELILVEWDGIKRDWTDDDLLDDDAQLKKAIKMYVQAQRARDYDCDQQKYLQYRAEYEDVRSWLWWECEQETKLKDCAPRKSRWSEVTLEEQAPLVLPTTTTSTTTNTLWRCSSGDCVQGNGTLDTLFDCRLTGCELPPECPPVPTSCPEGWVIAYDDNECLICCDVSEFDAVKVGFLQSLWELLLCRPAPCNRLYHWASTWASYPDLTEEDIQTAWLLSTDYLNALQAGKGCGDPPPVGRCCLPDGSCRDTVLQVECDMVGGEWDQGEYCRNADCTSSTSTTTSTTTPPPPYSCVDGACVHDPDGVIMVWQECLDTPPCNTTTSTTTCSFADSGSPPEGLCPDCSIPVKNADGCWECCDLGAGCTQALVDCITDFYVDNLCRRPDCGGLRYWVSALQGRSCAAATVAMLNSSAYQYEIAHGGGCGACCLPDESCIQLSPSQCRLIPGATSYPGRTCGDPAVPCATTSTTSSSTTTTTSTTTEAPTGRCCIYSGGGSSCSVVSAADCAAAAAGDPYSWVAGEQCALGATLILTVTEDCDWDGVGDCQNPDRVFLSFETDLSTSGAIPLTADSDPCGRLYIGSSQRPIDTPAGPFQFLGNIQLSYDSGGNKWVLQFSYGGTFERSGSNPRGAYTWSAGYGSQFGGTMIIT